MRGGSYLRLGEYYQSADIGVVRCIVGDQRAFMPNGAGGDPGILRRDRRMLPFGADACPSPRRLIVIGQNHESLQPFFQLGLAIFALSGHFCTLIKFGDCLKGKTQSLAEEMRAVAFGSLVAPEQKRANVCVEHDVRHSSYYA